MSALFYLNFHGVGEPHAGVDAGERPYWISAAQLRDVLARADRDVGITFDDGNISDLTEAAPALQQAGLRAEFFICTDRIGAPHYLGAEDIRALMRAGMGIGSHGLAHVRWSDLGDVELEAEIGRPLQVLSEITGAPVRSVGVPFGDYDGRVLKALRRHGVTTVFTSDGGPARPGAWLLPRTSVRNDMSLAQIDAMLAAPRSAMAYYKRAAKRAVRRALKPFVG